MRAVIRLSVCFLLTLFFTSCLDDDEEKDWSEEALIEVSAEPTMCYIFDGYVPGINIRRKEADKWDAITLDEIAGFEYEPGFEYELLVKITHLANPPADSSNVTYELIKMITQREIE